MHAFRTSLLLASAFLLTATSADAQRRTRDRDRETQEWERGRSTDRERSRNQEWSEGCDRDFGGRDGGHRFCETREYTVRGSGALRVNADPNGGVRVRAWDRDEVRVIATVRTWAREERDARDLAEDVAVEIDGRTVRSTGPRMEGSRRASWSVSYEIMAPARTDLHLTSTNGGLAVEGISGLLQLETTNGGIHLDAVGGDVRAETVNGGVSVDLEGRQWTGRGLDVKTTNGGVRLIVPDRFNADLDASVVNGGIDVDFPVMVRGRIGRRISTTLGDGGPSIRLSTTNGGVTIRRG